MQTHYPSRLPIEINFNLLQHNSLCKSHDSFGHHIRDRGDENLCRYFFLMFWLRSQQDKE